jgi:hypothetical protein
MEHGKNVAVVAHVGYKLLCLPTKPLEEAKPWNSWNQPSCPKLIRQGLQELVSLVDQLGITRVAMGYPGCGNGSLDRNKIKPLLDKYLDPRFLVLDLNGVTKLAR